jgi:hypothetical protein
MMNNVGRKFKTVQTIDGSTLKPSDYIFLMKALDK